MRGPPGVVREHLARGVPVSVRILRRAEIRAGVHRDAIAPARDTSRPAAVAEPPKAPVPLRRIGEAELAADERLRRWTQHKRHAQAALAVIDGGDLAIRDLNALQAFEPACGLGFQIGRSHYFLGGARSGGTCACRHRQGERESEESVSCDCHCRYSAFLLVQDYSTAPIRTTRYSE